MSGYDPLPASAIRLRLSRRRFLQLSAAAASAGALAALPAPGFLAAAGPTRSSSWTTTGATGGRAALYDFNAVVALVPRGVAWIEIQTSADGATWIPWRRLSPDSDARVLATWSALAVVPRARQVRFRLEEAAVVTWHAIDNAFGAPGRVTGLAEAAVQLARRPIWGADERLRYDERGERWTRVYRPTHKIALHHTVTPNDDPDPAATVRAIYHYHTYILGWGDIGYNYLVDRNGRIYEGRYGGSGVAGGHTAYGVDRQGRDGPNYNLGSVGIAVLGDYSNEPVPPAALDALTRLIAWKCEAWRLDPRGHGQFLDKDLPTVFAHRDAQPPGKPVPWLNGGTECCGLGFYRQLPAIRSGVAQRLAGMPTRPVSFAIPDGYFFGETSGRGPGVGYSVTNAEGVPFWDEFRRLGGVLAVGFPVSRRFMWDGFLCQAFQKLIFQADVNSPAWKPGGRRIAFVNTFDELHRAGKDNWLATARMTPPPDDTSPDGKLGWDAVSRRHLALLDRFPAIRARYFAVADPLTYHGLPMSAAEYRSARVVRCQRTVFQQWLVQTPWAKAGEVVLANGGDLAKEGGLLPDRALVPEEPPLDG